MQVRGKDKIIIIPEAEIKNFLKTIDNPTSGSTLISMTFRWFLIDKWKASSKAVVYKNKIDRNENLFYVMEQTSNEGEIVRRNPGKTVILYSNDTFSVGFLENE